MCKTPLISVTVPVYNTSRFLNQCIDSLVNQTLKEIEFLLVDDGSTDGSGDICDMWARQDKRIRVIHQTNGGSWKARQTGLDNAKGEYLIVCDSDDWVEIDAYRKAYDMALKENADIVMFGYTAEYGDGSRRDWIRKYSNPNDIEHTRGEIMQTSSFHSWDKLVRRSIFTNNRICYEPGINMGEDCLILHKLLNVRPLKLAVLPEALYHYRQSTGGYTTTIKQSSVEQLIRCLEWINNNIDTSRHADALKKSRADIAFESLRCDRFDKHMFKSITSNLTALYLYSSPRSLQKFAVLVGKIFGWKAGHMFYQKWIAQQDNFSIIL